MEKYYSAKEAAKEFNLSEKTLKDWLRAGKLKGEKAGRAWRISDSAIRDYLKIPISDDEADFLIEDEIISTLSNFQEKLLNVESSNKSGILRSRILRVAAMLDEIIDYLYDEEDVFEHRWDDGPHDDADAVRGVGSFSGIFRSANPDYRMTNILNSKNEIKLNDFIDKIVRSLIMNMMIDVELLNKAVRMIKATLESAVVGSGDIKRINKMLNVFKHLEYEAHNINKNPEEKGSELSINYFQAANFRQLQEVLPAWIKEMNVVWEMPDEEKSKG